VRDRVRVLNFRVVQIDASLPRDGRHSAVALAGFQSDLDASAAPCRTAACTRTRSVGDDRLAIASVTGRATVACMANCRERRVGCPRRGASALLPTTRSGRRADSDLSAVASVTSTRRVSLFADLCTLSAASVERHSLAGLRQRLS